MNKQKIGNLIKKKRKENGLTQKELAEKLDITDRAISKWERGICCPDISLLKDLCKILGININELLSGNELKEITDEESENILIETVKTYTGIEKKKNKRLLLFTVLLLIFYVFLVIAMYLTFNQLNRTDGPNWETIQTKKMTDKLFIALENYDYDYLKQMAKKQGDSVIEDENKCDESLVEYENWGIICRLKDFENNKIKFKSHEFIQQFYGSMGNFLLEYKYVITYENIDTELSITISSHNGVFNEIGGIGVEYPNNINLIKNGYFNVYEKIMLFFDYEEYPI